MSISAYLFIRNTYKNLSDGIYYATLLFILEMNKYNSMVIDILF